MNLPTSELTNNAESTPSDESEPPGVSSRCRDDQCEIAVADEQSLLAIDEQLIHRAIHEVLAFGDEPSASISVAIVDDAAMLPLNRQFLEHDYTTDVLSFALNSKEEPLSGELVVNAEYALATAQDVGWHACNELLLYVIHGMLHLVGYCDKSEESAQEMRAAEKRILRSLGIPTSPTDLRWTNDPQILPSEAKGNTPS